jgi:hypothetical protein
MAAANYPRQSINTAILPLTLSFTAIHVCSSLRLFLNHREYVPGDDGFMVVLHIVLMNDSVVDYFLFANISTKGFPDHYPKISYNQQFYAFYLLPDIITISSTCPETTALMSVL